MTIASTTPRPSGRSSWVSLARLLVAAAATVQLAASGCGSPTAPEQRELATGPPGVQSSTAEPLPERAVDGQPQGEVLADLWDASYMGEAKVGSSHTVIERLEEDGRPLIRTTVRQQLSLSRSEDVSEQTLKLVSVETPQGDVVRLISSIRSGETEIRSEGRVDGDKLMLKQTAGGNSQNMTLPWDAQVRGYFAIEQSLRREPMSEGESRKLRSFMPAVNQIAEISLQAAQQRKLEETAAGPQRLLQIDAELSVAGTTLKQSLWCDKSGDVLKSYDPQVQLTSYRTTREKAMAQSDAVFRFDDTVFIKATGSVDSPHTRSRAVYRVRLEDQNPADVFPSSGDQQVTEVNSREALIEIRKPPHPVPPGTAPTDEADKSPSTLIQSNDPRIRQLAEQVGEIDDPWQRAVALEKLVHEKVTSKNYSRAFDSAADVARTLEGDCTEHAVLLAALCRARGIPARVASGLVAYGEGFAYHMWTEVWIDGTWTPLDATLGRGGIGVGHIKLVDSNLAGANSFSALLPVLQVLGRLEIEVVSVQ